MINLEKLTLLGYNPLIKGYKITKKTFMISFSDGVPTQMENQMDKLRRVNWAAVRLIGGFKRFDHISQYMQDVWHWLPFPQRISYRITSLVRRCLSGCSSSYLRELCRPLSSCAGHRPLRSSLHDNLVVPFARSATLQTHSFSVVGPTTWKWTSNRSKAPPKQCLFSIPPPSQVCLFCLAWIGSTSE